MSDIKRVTDESRGDTTVARRYALLPGTTMIVGRDQGEFDEPLVQLTSEQLKMWSEGTWP